MSSITSKSLKIPEWAFTEESIRNWKKCCYQSLYKTFLIYRDSNIKRCNVYCQGCANVFRILQYSANYDGLTFTTESNKNYYCFSIGGGEAHIDFLFPASFGIWSPSKDAFLDNLVSARLLSPCGKKLIHGKYTSLDTYIDEVSKLPEGKNSWIDIDLKMTKSIMIVLEGISLIENTNKLLELVQRKRIEKLKQILSSETA